MKTESHNRIRLVAGLALVASSTMACADDRTQTGLGPQPLAVAGDTVRGTGSLSELQQRRAAWIARGVSDYRMQLQLSCFCGGQITRPVVVEVRGGLVAKVSDRETGQPVTNVAPYPTITGLFDKAIAERSSGGFVSVTYDRTLGLPVRLEVGTLANDAGTLYLLSGLAEL